MNKDCKNNIKMPELLTRKQFLKESREKAEHYKHKIEKKTGVDLGEPGIKNLNWHAFDFAKEILEIELLGAYEKKDFLINPFLSFAAFPLTLSILEIKHFFQKNTRAIYLSPNIYINTRKKVREPVLSEKNGLDKTMVHELSHVLWEKLGGELNGISEKGNERLSMMVEGFATYSAKFWFSDLYPIKQKHYLTDYWGLPDYQAGALRMMRFTEEYGEDILLKVPTQWRELDEKTMMLEPELLFSSEKQLKAFKGHIDYEE